MLEYHKEEKTIGLAPIVILLSVVFCAGMFFLYSTFGKG
jgi:hypothetical protein